MTEAETGGLCPQAQEGLPGAPSSWTGQEGPSLGALSGSSALGHVDVRVLAIMPGRGWILLFKMPSSWSFRKLTM